MPKLSEGDVLYMDLCGRLIKRILDFNPDEHDIELNLYGIISKAQEYEELKKRCGDSNSIELLIEHTLRDKTDFFLSIEGTEADKTIEILAQSLSTYLLPKEE